MKTATEQQKAAGEARRAKFRTLAKQLSALPAAKRAEIAAKLPAIATIEGRTLSTVNMCLVAAQFPTATIVGGFRQWLKAGRAVRKGEHGISLWVPAGTRKADGEQAETVTGDKVRFLAGVVFDVSQTEEIQKAEEVKATCEQAIADHFDPSGALRKAGILEVVHVGEAA